MRTISSIVRQIFDGELESGQHQFSWDGQNDQGQTVPSGVYIVRLQGPNFVSSEQLIFLGQ